MGLLITNKNDAARYLRGEAMPDIVEGFAVAVKGKKIALAGYLLEDGIAIPCLKLDDGSLILAASDDEFNDAGVLNYQKGDNSQMLCTTNPAEDA